MGYQYTIVYKPGRANHVADALTRQPEDTIAQFLAISHIQFELLNLLREENATSSFFLTKYKELAADVRDGLLMYKGKILLDHTSPLVQSVLQECHSTPLGGHGGMQKTMARVCVAFSWDGVKRDVKKFVQECDICQRVKYSTQATPGLLQPLPILDNVWEDLSMDFIIGLPVSEGYSTILVVVDRFSKQSHFGALPMNYSAPKVAQLFATMVCKLHGIPTSIVSDRDPIFLSKFWIELFALSGTVLKRITAYHPKTNGQSKVLNRILQQYLRCFVAEKPTKWYRFLHWAEYCYNANFHSSLGMSPFKAVYGREPPSMLNYVPMTATTEGVNRLLMDKQDLLQELKGNLAKA